MKQLIQQTYSNHLLRIHCWRWINIVGIRSWQGQAIPDCKIYFILSYKEAAPTPRDSHIPDNGLRVYSYHVMLKGFQRSWFQNKLPLNWFKLDKIISILNSELGNRIHLTDHGAPTRCCIWSNSFYETWSSSKADDWAVNIQASRVKSCHQDRSSDQ